ncbi:MAG: peptide ABC transporter substrate-binding protein [Puniceicoccales bacterium]|jgi:oligopeptide transport system substrate-binding protein|nr:peptide ABC transporter substrate-binding protein [Puniceicoccales bacterium]
MEARLWPCALALSLLAAGCGGRSGGEDGAGTLRLGNAAEPNTLDPQRMMDFSPIFIARGLFECLVLLDDATLCPLPGAAERWEISEDGLVYRFFLRPDGRWSNGEPVVAEDFVQAARRILSPRLASPTVDLYFPLKNAQAHYEGRVPWDEVGIRARDRMTLEISLERPTPYFLALLAHPAWSPIPRPCIEAHGGWERWDSDWTRPGNLVSNGPYRLEEWRVGDRIAIGKNPFHRSAGDGGPERVIFFPIVDQQTEQNAFDCGELDATATVPAELLDELRGRADGTLQETESLGCFYYLCNCSRPPLDNGHLRRALALAIDREELCRLIHRDVRFAAGNLVPAGTGGYRYGGRETLGRDPRMAREELAAAGFPGGAGLPPMTLTFNHSSLHRLVAQAVQEMWRRELGIAVELRCEDWKAFLHSRRVGNFAIARGGWVGDFNDPLTFLGLFVGDSPNNFVRWRDEAYDGEMRAAEEEEDRGERLRHLESAEDRLLREMPIIPLYFETHKRRVAERVRGWRPNLLDYHLYQNVRLR